MVGSPQSGVYPCYSTCMDFSLAEGVVHLVQLVTCGSFGTDRYAARLGLPTKCYDRTGSPSAFNSLPQPTVTSVPGRKWLIRSELQIGRRSKHRMTIDRRQVRSLRFSVVTEVPIEPSRPPRGLALTGARISIARSRSTRTS